MIKHGCCAMSADFVSLYFDYKHYIGDEDGILVRQDSASAMFSLEVT